MDNPFVLGFPSISQIWEADYHGVESGYNTDKPANIGYKTIDAKTVYAPIIYDFMLSPECEIVNTVTAGSHSQVTGVVKRSIAEDRRI